MQIKATRANAHDILEIFSHPQAEKQDTNSNNSSDTSGVERMSAHMHLVRKEGHPY